MSSVGQKFSIGQKSEIECTKFNGESKSIDEMKGLTKSNKKS